ncbi:preprotein translocase subunit SecG [Neorickettsia sennetsu]|uniref:Protein-export membrane protein SecG n=1 Tax=Ehrlichia sennetsu (strain ATCC VR-367 / Miyayama) TaxID=222891 RepID=Q2GCQ3_EHRS3|nr:preprotein translocase subunit SecG [Neorickettsia sennetsu]ABD46264.1 preprotein translocase, SecG subunit [Neorickettsia sennetsu str. Miyayama]
MLFLIVLQFIVAVLIVTLVLCQSSGSDVAGTFTSGRRGLFPARSVSGLFVRFTWVLLLVFFLNTILLGRLNFTSNTEVITNEVEEELERALEADHREAENVDYTSFE